MSVLMRMSGWAGLPREPCRAFRRRASFSPTWIAWASAMRCLQHAGARMRRGTGNEWLLAETAAHPRLHPCLTLVPGTSRWSRRWSDANGKDPLCEGFPEGGAFLHPALVLGPIAEGLLALPHGALFVDFELTGWGDEGSTGKGSRPLLALSRSAGGCRRGHGHCPATLRWPVDRVCQPASEISHLGVPGS